MNETGFPVEISVPSKNGEFTEAHGAFFETYRVVETDRIRELLRRNLHARAWIRFDDVADFCECPPLMLLDELLDDCAGRGEDIIHLDITGEL